MGFGLKISNGNQEVRFSDFDKDCELNIEIKDDAGFYKSIYLDKENVIDIINHLVKVLSKKNKAEQSDPKG